jgi:hypothetical protein
MRTRVRILAILVVAASTAILYRCTGSGYGEQPNGKQEPPVTRSPLAELGWSVSLSRKDLLPPIAGKYELDFLPSTEKHFALICEHFGNGAKAFPAGDNAEMWICEWQGEPPGQKAGEPWSYGSDAGLTSQDGSCTAVVLRGQYRNDRHREILYVFRDLRQIVAADISDHRAEVASVSSAGDVALSLKDKEDAAIFLSPGKELRTESFPGRFLYWDFSQQVGIYSIDRKVCVKGRDGLGMEAELPFVVDAAFPMGEGRLMVSSRPIGKGGPRWRVLLDQKAKVLGENVLGGWDLLPDRMSLSRNGRDSGAPRRPSEYIVGFREAGCWTPSSTLDLHSLPSLDRAHSFPRSNAFHPYECFDSRGNIYSLIEEHASSSAKEEQRIVLLSQYGKPVEVLLGRDVAQVLGHDSVSIYSMTVSRDGNWLAIVVLPGWSYEKDAKRWLLQYRIERKNMERY